MTLTFELNILDLLLLVSQLITYLVSGELCSEEVGVACSVLEYYNILL